MKTTAAVIAFLLVAWGTSAPIDAQRRADLRGRNEVALVEAYL